MNREDIIRMAREAGWSDRSIFGHDERLERFAALVAAAEREVWAKYLDDCGEHEHANYIRYAGR